MFTHFHIIHNTISFFEAKGHILDIDFMRWFID